MRLSTMRFAATVACLTAMTGSAMAQISPPEILRVSLKRVVRSDGTVAPAWSNAAINAMFAEANQIFSTAGITLIQSEPVVDFLDPGYPYSFYDVNLGPYNPTLGTYPRMTAMESAAETSPGRYEWRTDAINVYLTNSISGPLGICSFPAPFAGSDDDDLILVQSAAGSGYTDGYLLAHEIGHYLGLFHTFETFLGAENVASCNQSSNCAVAGDLVCDTVADPFGAGANLTQLASVHNPGACPTPYNWLANNAMSYYPVPAGLGLFTPGQASRMSTFITGARYQVRQVTAPVNGPVIGSASLVGNTITLTGLSLQPPFVASNFPVTVGIGQTFCTGLTSATPTCSAEMVSGAPSAISYANLTATFPGTVPPGDHTVNLYYGGDLVATLPNALQVGPSIEHTVVNPLTTVVRDRVRSSTGGADNFLLAVGPEAPPTPFANGAIRIDLTSPAVLTLNVAVPATGFTDIFYPLSAIAPATSSAIQGIELSTNLVTNMVRVTRP